MSFLPGELMFNIAVSKISNASIELGVHNVLNMFLLIF